MFINKKLIKHNLKKININIKIKDFNIIFITNKYQ